MKTTSVTTLSAIALACSMLAGCGGGGDSTPPSEPPDPGPTSYTVTPSVNGSGGSISPATAVAVPAGGGTSFSLAPNSGYTIASVGGTCGGTLSGNTYTTSAISGNCTVVATFAPSAPPPASGSIKACFTVPAAGVRYGYSSINAPGTNPITIYPVSVVLRQVPYTYNGQSVTAAEAVATYTDGKTETVHWTLTSNSVIEIDKVSLHTNSTQPSGLEYPDNMQVGQTVQSPTDHSSATFAGYENLTLAGKTFANTCHFSYSDPTTNNATAGDVWYAPGYGLIKQVTSAGWTLQYSGDL